MKSRLGLLLVLFVALLMVAVSGAQAAQLDRAPEKILEWNQFTQTVAQGSVWRDISGVHYRDFGQVAKFTGDCNGELSIVVSADMSPEGNGMVYGSMRFASAPQGCFRSDFGSAVGYEGKFEYDVKENLIVGGSLTISNATGTQELVMTELKHIGGSFLEPVLFLRGHSNLFRISPGTS